MYSLVALGKEQGAKVAEFDTGFCLGRYDGFRMICNAQARCSDHVEIIRAVAHCERCRHLETAGGREFLQDLKLGKTIKNWLANFAGKRRTVVQQRVGAVQFETKLCRHAACEPREAARDQRRGSVVRSHRADKLSRARRHLDGRPGLFQCIEIQALQHRHAFTQCRSEIDLAVHAALGDRRDFSLKARIGAKFIQSFGADDGAVHVGNKQAFAPTARLGHDGINGRVFQRRLDSCGIGQGGAGDVAGLARREQYRIPAMHGVADTIDDGGAERGGGAIGHKCKDIGHESGLRAQVMLPQALIVAGPTCSGKSALAMDLAERLGGTVINADSMQVYRDLRIVTARPTLADEARVQHLLYGVRGAAEAGSVAWWRNEALRAMAEAPGLPILCGGTGLYFSALTDGIAAVPQPTPEARDEARGLLLEIGAPALHARLAEADPVTAGRLHPTDSQRVARAWEVWRSSGQGLAAWQAQTQTPAPWRFTAIILDPPRDPLRAAIARRFDAMIAAGALDEVRSLLAQHLDPTLPAMRAVGVPELAAHLRGEISLEDASARASLASGQYIKRQATWFRNRKLTEPTHVQTIHAQIAGLEQFSERFTADLFNFIQHGG